MKTVAEKLKAISKQITDQKGYIKSMNPKDNLYKPLDIWDEIKNEISKGQGNELKTKKAEFCALHSSSALCVNNFANFKKP